ncbi:MAG: cob(I)yrinic acid a,c-diamide adenosyltransferase [Armatimonadota bacterium]|nr:MAG: cob(I)yrinic acid a,c-diamide adenosyltransferase [Armatimonadota bacterium]
MSALSRGLIQVYTGTGKGKTTAALGLAMRAAGHGLRVCFVQLLKRGWDSGERKAAQRLSPEIEIHAFGAPQWGDQSKADKDTPWWELPPSEEDRKQAREGALFALRAVTSGDYDIVVLDEVFGALKLGLISLEEVMELIQRKPPKVELVLTGREAPDEVLGQADLVTEMNAVKHPYHRGIEARRGIEY